MGMILKRLRPLPIAIFFAALFLTVRLGGLWHDIHIGVGEKTEAQAAPGPNAAPTPATAPASTAAPATAPTAAAANPNPPAADSTAKAQPAKTAATAQSATLPVDFTDSEIGLLQSLAQRRDKLDARARELDMREGLLKAAEKRVDEKIARLTQLQQTLDGLLKQYDAKQNEKIQSLVKIYEAMKPRDAARIWDGLDMPVLLEVAAHMSERKVAPILAAMNPDTVKKITDELARRRQVGELGTGGSS